MTKMIIVRRLTLKSLITIIWPFYFVDTSARMLSNFSKNTFLSFSIELHWWKTAIKKNELFLHFLFTSIQRCLTVPSNLLMSFLSEYFMLSFILRPTLPLCLSVLLGSILFKVYVPGISLNIRGKSLQYATKTNILKPYQVKWFTVLH